MLEGHACDFIGTAHYFYSLVLDFLHAVVPMLIKRLLYSMMAMIMVLRTQRAISSYMRGCYLAKLCNLELTVKIVLATWIFDI